jgi:hypothetical protein
MRMWREYWALGINLGTGRFGAPSACIHTLLLPATRLNQTFTAWRSVIFFIPLGVWDWVHEPT